MSNAASSSNAINEPDEDTGRTPLYDAILHHYYRTTDLDEVKRLLAQPGIDVNKRNTYSKYDKDTSVPLHGAINVSHTEIEDRPKREQEEISETITKLLLARPEIDPNVYEDTTDEGTPMGDTPLLNAVKYGHSGVVKLLLEHPKTNPNLPEAHWWDDNTPLHIAVNRNREDVIKLLVAHPKIDLSIKNKKGQTAYDLAKNEKIRRLIKPVSRGLAEISNQTNFPPEVTGLIYEQVTGKKPSLSKYFERQHAYKNDLSPERKKTLSNLQNQKKLQNKESQKYQARIAAEKEAIEQKKQADKEFQEREKKLINRDPFKANPDTSGFQGTNPHNLGGRKTRRNKNRAKKTRRN